jgi:class 3 adenylate cyclase
VVLHDGTWTIVFTDLVGSTEQRTRLGDEIGDALRREHDDIVRIAAGAHDGEIVKGTGDGTLVAFSGAAEALAATIAIQQGIERRNRGAAEPLSVRIGVSLGDARYESADLHGTAVNEAARICALADGGQILCSELVRAVAGSRTEATFTPAGAHELRGLPNPVSVLDVAWTPLTDAAPSREQPIPPGLDPGTRFRFVGRTDELATAMARWKEVAEGGRALLLVAGEPGIGKTRLAIEVANEAHEDDALVLYGRCDDELGVSYQPFVEACTWYLDHTPIADPAMLGKYGGELVRLVPELSARVRDLPPRLQSDPETEQYRLFEAVAAWLAALSAERPVLLVIDDLHWATKPTLQMLTHLAKSAETMRLLVIGTYRDTDLERTNPLTHALADLRRLPDVTRLGLSGLDRDEVLRVLESTAGHELDDRGRELAGGIHAETEGNPFFVEEVLRHLAETGRIYERDGRWTIDDPSSVGIPEGVREVIGRRLDRLSERTNEVLLVAAVAGQSFELDVLSQLVDLDEDELLEALDEAGDARLVREVGVGQYRFSHALVRSTLYDEMRPTRRARVHHRVGETIERVHSNVIEQHLGELAHHFGAAGPADAAKALEFCRRAGERALEVRAPDEAVGSYEQALDLLHDDPELADEQARGRLLLGLGIARRRAGIAGYREVLLEAAGVAEAEGDTPLLVEAALANHRGFFSAVGVVDAERVGVLRRALAALDSGETPERARLLANLAVELVFEASLDERRALSDEALTIARMLSDAPTTVHVLISRAIAIAHPSTVDERLEFTAEALSLARRLGDPTLAFFASYYSMFARTESAKEGVDALFDDMATLVVECGQATPAWVDLIARSGLAAMRAASDEAEQIATDGLEAGQRAGQPDATFMYGLLLFILRRQEGRLAEIAALVPAAIADAPGVVGMGMLEAILGVELADGTDAHAILRALAPAVLDTAPENQVWSSVVWACGYVAARLGDIEWSSRVLDVLAPYRACVAYNGLFSFGSIPSLMGLLATTLQRFDDADEWFAAGAALERRIGARALVTQTESWWAMSLRERGTESATRRAVELEASVEMAARDLGLRGLTGRGAR